MEKQKSSKLRFLNFADPWKRCRLSDICDVRDGTHDSPAYLDSGHPFVTSKNVKDGSINFDDVQYISDKDFESINKRSKVDVNDILMGMIGTIGNLALIRTEPNFAIKNVALIKDTNQVNYLYLYQYLQSPSIKTQLSSGMDGGTQKFVALKKIRDLKIMVPSGQEQRKIGAFFEKLDCLIMFHENKCEENKTLKKALLQKMFPTQGETIPEVRFPGFTGPWEQRKLGDVAGKTYGGGTPKTSVDEYWGGSIPWIQSSNLTEHQLFDTGVQKYITELGLQKSAAQLVPKNSIAVVSHVGVGKLVFMPFEYTTSQDFISLSDLTTDPVFACYAIYKKLQEDVNIVQGSAIKGITKEVLLNKEITLPGEDEQRAIGSTLLSLDNLITLHQRKYDELKELKKGLLQQMFI